MGNDLSKRREQLKNVNKEMPPTGPLSVFGIESISGSGEEALRSLLNSLGKIEASESERLAEDLRNFVNSSQWLKDPESEWRTKVDEQLKTLNSRTLRHSSQLEHFEAKLENSSYRRRFAEKSVSAIPDDFDAIMKHLEEIENQPEDQSKVLYHFMELESLFENSEKTANMFSKLYEARLASTLKNICKIHEPSDLTVEQLKLFVICVRAFLDGRGSLTKEKVDYIRKRLLEQKLTWLPVTNKALQIIEKNRKGIDDKGAIS